MAISKDVNEDNIEYWHFTGPQRIEKAMHNLQGILVGISCDGVIEDSELKFLKQWMAQNEEISNKLPFSEIFSYLHDALSDGVLDKDEADDLLWICRKFLDTGDYYNLITSDLQELHGVMGGIASDGIISKNELESLSKWLDEHVHLKGHWPYDELESLILQILKDGVIDEEEHKLLRAFFSEFLSRNTHKIIMFPLNEVDKPLMGLCAVCPEITIESRTFCFTGKFTNLSRNELGAMVEKYGGKFSKDLTKDVDYLVIGSEGNQAWAYSCYGRKVEKAIQLRKEGKQITIAHEFDFWDAIEELK